MWARARFARAMACVRTCLTTPACIRLERLRGGFGERRDLAELREALQRVVLDAAHAFGREPEQPPGLAQRRGVVAVDPVAQLDHAALLLRKLVERRPHGLVAQADLDLLVRLALLTREQVA